MSRLPIKVNGVVIPAHVIAEEAQHHPARTPRLAYEAAARALVVRTLLLEEALRRGIEAEPSLVAEGKRETEDEARVRALIAHVASVSEAGEAECRALYDANPARFVSPDLFEAAHILFAARPMDKDAYADAFRRAAATISELQDAPQKFEAIARERSDCESRANGGRLGQTPRGQLVPEIEAALDALDEGETGIMPVKSRHGVHVVRLDRRARGETLPYEYVRARIAAWLAERNWRQAVARFIDGLIERAVIEGIDMNPQGVKAA
jgi:peptidyl-prolyl cis-trans isomerase C